MTDPELTLARQVQDALAAQFGAAYADADPVIRPSQFADYQSNVALPLARRLSRAPREIAAELAARLDGSDAVASAEASGPGFINLTLRDDWIADQVTAQLRDTCDEIYGELLSAHHVLLFCEHDMPSEGDHARRDIVDAGVT